MISRFVGSSPASGSVLTGQSLESASDSVSPSLSAPPPTCVLVLVLSLSLSNIKESSLSALWILFPDGYVYFVINNHILVFFF